MAEYYTSGPLAGQLVTDKNRQTSINGGGQIAGKKDPRTTTGPYGNYDNDIKMGFDPIKPDDRSYTFGWDDPSQGSRPGDSNPRTGVGSSGGGGGGASGGGSFPSVDALMGDSGGGRVSLGGRSGGGVGGGGNGPQIDTSGGDSLTPPSMSAMSPDPEPAIAFQEAGVGSLRQGIGTRQPPSLAALLTRGRPF